MDTKVGTFCDMKERKKERERGSRERVGRERERERGVGGRENCSSLLNGCVIHSAQNSCLNGRYTD